MSLINAMNNAVNTMQVQNIQQHVAIDDTPRTTAANPTGYTIELRDLNEKIWTDGFFSMENFTCWVVNDVRPQTDQRLRYVCFCVGHRWFNHNGLNQFPTTFRRRVQSKAAKFTPDMKQFMYDITQPLHAINCVLFQEIFGSCLQPECIRVGEVDCVVQW